MNDTASTASKAPPALPRLDLGLRLGLGLVLALVGLAVYWPALSAEFVYDDHGLVEGNARIATVGTALQSFFEPLWGQGAGAVIDNMFWRPLTVLTLAVEKALFGLKPERFHQVSLLLHLLASWAAWRLATRLLRCPTTGWLAALLFAAHPVHVESVAWISAVNDPASALFALLSLERYFAWREGGLRGVPWAAGVLLLIGLLFKETALVVPVVAFTIDLAFRHLKLRGAEGLLDFLRAYAPWAVGALLYVVGRVVAYGSVLAGFDQASAGFGLDLGREMQLRIEILGGFLEALFVHGDPRFFRQVRPVLPHGYGPWTVAVVSSLVWLAALGAAIWQKRQLALGMLLAIPASFVLLLLKIEAAGAFPISDRFLYLTVIFAAVLVVGLIDKLAPRKATIVIGLALTVVAGLQARARVLVFEDDLSLYRAAVEAEPDNLRGRTFLGSVLFQRYKETNEKDYLDEAMFHFLKALMLGFDYGQRAPKLGADAPFIARAKELDVILNGVGRDKLELDDTVFRSGVDRMDANIGLGNCALALGQLPPEFDLDWPREIFEYILSAFPNEVRALDGLGRTYYRMGDYEKAESKFREAVDIDGTFSDAWFNLGQMLGELGRADEGRVCFDQVLRLRPGYLRALDSATRLAIDGKRYPQAEAYLQQIDQDHPGSLDAIFLRGMLRASRGDMAGAVRQFDLLLAQEDNNARGHLWKGRALLQLSQNEDAIRALKRAAELDTDNFEAHNTLGLLFLSQPHTQDLAYPYLERAYFLSGPTELRLRLHSLLLTGLKQAAQTDELAWQKIVEYSQFDRGRGDFERALSWIDAAGEVLGGVLAGKSNPEEVGPLAGSMVFLYLQKGELLEALARVDQQQRLSRLREARDAYLAGLKIAPEHFLLNHNLALFYARFLNRVDLAKPYAQKALDHIEQAERNFQQGAAQAMGSTMRAILKAEVQPGPFLADPLGDAQDEESGQ